MADRAEDAQGEVLRGYTVLRTIRADWAGALILNLGLGPQGAAVSLASNMAGAVCLSLEEDPVLLRSSLRTGACDFVVNTLDEALRAMKNEVRKQLPLSVGLEGNRSTLLDELLDRGVAPEVFIASPAAAEFALRFQSLGSLVLSFDERVPIAGALSAPLLLAAFVAARAWRLSTFRFTTSADVRAFDARALALLPADDFLRRQWLLSAPRLLPRERHRTLWLSEGEEQLLTRESG